MLVQSARASVHQFGAVGQAMSNANANRYIFSFALQLCLYTIVFRNFKLTLLQSDPSVYF